MPTYDYFCEKCDITIEVTHSIHDSPEVLCEKCNEKMRRVMSGGVGYIMKSGGTRSQTWAQRHGHKKDSASTTPSESAQLKGTEKLSEIQNAAAKAADPYHAFRE